MLERLLKALDQKGWLFLVAGGVDTQNLAVHISEIVAVRTSRRIADFKAR